MIRGKALRDELIPRLDASAWGSIDPVSYARYIDMKARYARFLDRPAMP
jgi:hypothetical protein